MRKGFFHSVTAILLAMTMVAPAPVFAAEEEAAEPEVVVEEVEETEKHEEDIKSPSAAEEKQAEKADIETEEVEDEEEGQFPEENASSEAKDIKVMDVGILNVSNSMTENEDDPGREILYRIQIKIDGQEPGQEMIFPASGKVSSVTFAANGIAEVYLADDENVAIELPDGYTYSAWPVMPSGNLYSYREPQNSMGTIASGATRNVGFSIYRCHATLTVSHTTNGYEADPDKEFVLVMSLKGLDGETPVSATYGNAVFDGNGEYTFIVKNGDTVSIPAIPTGYTYSITKASQDEYNGGFSFYTGVGVNGSAVLSDVVSSNKTIYSTATRSVGKLTFDITETGKGSSTTAAGTLFDYTLTLTKDDGVTPVTGSISGLTFDENGQANLRLSKNENGNYFYVPVGYHYSLEAVDNDAYDVTVENGTGVISANGSTIGIVRTHKVGDMDFVLEPGDDFADMSHVFSYTFYAKNGRSIADLPVEYAVTRADGHPAQANDQGTFTGTLSLDLMYGDSVSFFEIPYRYTIVAAAPELENIVYSYAVEKNGEEVLFREGTKSESWRSIGIYVDSDNAMVSHFTTVDLSGWQTEGKNTYYLDKDGNRVTGFQEIDYELYYFDENGVLQKSKWISVAGKSYLAKSDGSLYRGTNVINGKEFYFDPETGARKLGLVRIDIDQIRYYTGTGCLKNEWKTVGNVTYYFQENGDAAMNGDLEIDGMTYSFGPNGELQAQAGLCRIGDDIYYYDENGKLAKSAWKTIDGATYFFGADGKAYKGLRKIGSKEFFFDENSKRKLGLVSTEDGIYYMLASGTLKDSWKQSGSKRYYFGADGKAYTGLHSIDGDVYCFGDDGAMIKGRWMTIDKKVCFFGTDGKAYTGVRVINNKTFYFSEGGVLLGSSAAA